MFSDLDVLQNLLDAKVDKTQKINGVALNSNEVSMNADKVPDGTTKVVMTSAERTKLAGVATGATANSTDASLRDRANHTGAQSISTVTGLQSSLNLPVSNTVTEIWRGTQAMYDRTRHAEPRPFCNSSDGFVYGYFGIIYGDWTNRDADGDRMRITAEFRSDEEITTDSEYVDLYVVFTGEYDLGVEPDHRLQLHLRDRRILVRPVG